MANNFENKPFIPTGLEIVLYNDQETINWRECTNNVIAAEPISWMRPEDAFDVVEGDESPLKRKRCTDFEVEVESDKEFILLELYKYSNNVDEIILSREKDGITLDTQKLLQNLKGWTVKNRKRPQKTGKNRIDKTYRHPKSKRDLRSTVEVRKFIEEISCIKQTSDNNERVSMQNARDAQTNMYLQLYRRWEETFCKRSLSSWSEQREAIRVPNSACGDTFKSHETLDYNQHSNRPSHNHVSFSSTLHGVPLSSHMIRAPQLEKISDSSKQEAFTNGQECVRTFGVGPLAGYDFGVGSSSTNIAQVAKKDSHYEKAQKELTEKMESMERLLVGGALPPFQFPNTRRS